MRISIKFVWYDLWIGFFFDRKNKRLYFCPLPCIVFIIERGKSKHKSNLLDNVIEAQKTQEENPQWLEVWEGDIRLYQCSKCNYIADEWHDNCPECEAALSLLEEMQKKDLEETKKCVHLKISETVNNCSNCEASWIDGKIKCSMLGNEITANNICDLWGAKK